MKITSSAATSMRSWWQQREPRERTMLTVMCAAIAAFAWWYGAFVPLRHLRNDAREHHAMAAMQMARMKIELAHLAELQGRLPPRPTNLTDVRKSVIESAKLAGMPITRDRDAAPGVLELESDSVSPKALFAWLDALRLRHGLAPSMLSVAKNGDQLRMQASFRAVQDWEEKAD